MTDPRREHLDELLADGALFGLDDERLEEARREADALGMDLEGEQARWDRVAGTATAVVLSRSRELVPQELMRKLQADALSFYARRGAVRWEELVHGQSPSRSPRLPTERNPWLTYVAAAAALLLAFAVLFGPGAGTGLAPEQARAVLLSSGVVDVRHDWKPTDNPAAQGLEGDVVWSTVRQEGYLRLRGLAPNDPSVRQYQLWIVDGKRGMPPVDGGVFDIPAEVEEAVVPIAAKLAVDAAQLFVITVEPAGGVVVSAPEKYAAVAGG